MAFTGAKKEHLKGIGPKRAALLAKLGIFSSGDLAFYFPRGWEDRRLKTEENRLLEKPDIFFGESENFREIRTSSSLRIFSVFLKNEKTRLECVFFRRVSGRFDIFAPLKKDFAPGNKVWVKGVIERDFFAPKMRAEEYYPESRAPKEHINSIVPVYSLTEGLSQKFMRETVKKALELPNPQAGEFLPLSLIKARELSGRVSSLRDMHFPDCAASLEKARNRFIYEELFLLALAWGIKKRQLKSAVKKFPCSIKRTLLTPFKNNLGFEFTASQKKAINEIFSDMTAPNPMNRLLQGEVGSGKTAVALSACLLAAENGLQSVFMAPTEILAEQHFLTFGRLLKGLNVRYEILTSSAPAAKKKEILLAAATGEIDILIGTHAVIEKEITFKNLGLAVIDEQHRFGVRQRAALRKKGDRTDLLVMTATPIPRTLLLSLYGDLDVSTLDELPAGRKTVKTIITGEEKALSEIKKLARGGNQAYIVYPVIEDNPAGLKSLKKEYGRLKDFFSGLTTAMLHGRMKAAEKSLIMEKFAAGETSILLSTQVIEVGIDVPGASAILIQNPERFGLAALHQLRGRVGRAGQEAFCFLAGEETAGEQRERLLTLCRISNGFELSEKDAYLRGAGEVIGLKQHGDMELKIASLSSDSEIFKKAAEDRNLILGRDPLLLSPENSSLRGKLLGLYGEKLALTDLN